MAFELNKLGDKLKAQGLPIVEDGAEKVFKCVTEFLKEECMAHPNGLFKMAVPVIEVIEPLVQNQIDKIDGQAG